MDAQHIAEELRTQLRERPYWTTAAIIGVGWILGRSLPLRAVLAVASIGAQAAMAAAQIATHTANRSPADNRTPLHSPLP